MPKPVTVYASIDIWNQMYVDLGYRLGLYQYIDISIRIGIQVFAEYRYITLNMPDNIFSLKIRLNFNIILIG
jgi:hypothetical protein